MKNGTMNMRGAVMSGENFFDLRLLFPEGFAHFGKNLPAAQFRRMLQDGRGGLVVQRRAVAEHHQRGIGKTFTLHAPKLAQPHSDRKPRPSDADFY